MENYKLVDFKELDNSNFEYIKFLNELHLKSYKERFDFILKIAIKKCNTEKNITLLNYISDSKESFFYHCIKEPSFIFWINGLEDILLEYRNIDPKSNFTKICLTEINIIENTQLDFLISQAGKFVTSHAVKYSNTFLYSLEIDDIWIPDDKYFYPSVKTIKINKIKDGKIISNQNFTENKKLVPSFSLNEGSYKFHVHNFDIFFNFNSIERWKKTTDLEILENNSLKIKESLLLIEKFLPGFNRQLELLVKQFIPMSTDGKFDTQSGTYSGLFGAIYLTIPESPYFIAEMIIHEFNHHKLFLLEEIHPLFDVENFEQIHYSPLRNHLRTQQGAYHALFVISEILKFWALAYEFISEEKLKDIAIRRIWTVIYQIKFGSSDLINLSKLSEIGKNILNEILLETTILEKRLPKISNDTKPYYTEIKVNMNLLNLPILDSIILHRKEVWEQAGPNIIKPINHFINDK